MKPLFIGRWTRWGFNLAIVSKMTYHWHRRLAWTHLFPVLCTSSISLTIRRQSGSHLTQSWTTRLAMLYPTASLNIRPLVFATKSIWILLGTRDLVYIRLSSTILSSWWAIEKLKFKYYYTRLHSRMMNLSLKERMQYRLWIEESSSQRVRHSCKKRHQNRKGDLNRSEKWIRREHPTHHLAITSIEPLRDNCPVRDDTSSR